MREVIKKLTYDVIISYEYRTQHYKHYFNEEGIYIYSINVLVKGCSELRIKNSNTITLHTTELDYANISYLLGLTK